MWTRVSKTTIAKLLALVFGVGTLAVSARILGPEGRGIIAGVTTWLSISATLGCFSLGQVALHRAANSKGYGWLGSAFGILVVAAILLTVATWIILLGIWVLAPVAFGNLPPWALILGFSALPFFLWEHYAPYLLMGAGQLSFVNHRQVVVAAIGFLTLAGVLALGGGIPGALAVIIGATALTATVDLARVWRIANAEMRFAWNDAHAMGSDALKLHFNAVGGVLLAGTDVLMVNYYLPPADVGHYQLAVQLLVTLMIIPASSAMVLNEMMSIEGPDRMWPAQKRLILQLLVLMVGLGVVAYGLAPWIVTLLAGEDFGPSAEVFRILLLSLVGMSLSHAMANQWLGRGLFMQTAALTLASGIVNFLLNLFTIPRFGIHGAAWTTVIVYGVGMMTNLGMALHVESKSRQRLTEDPS